MAIYDSGTSFSVTATNSTSAVATQAAVTTGIHFIYAFSGSSDKAGGLILVKDGTTVIWQDRVSSTCPAVYSLLTPLRATKGNSVSVTVDGTAIANANIAGVTVTTP